MCLDFFRCVPVVCLCAPSFFSFVWRWFHLCFFVILIVVMSSVISMVSVDVICCFCVLVLILFILCFFACNGVRS